MDTALILIRSEASRLLLFMIFPAGLIFFGTFFAAVTKERRGKNPQQPTRAMLGSFERTPFERTQDAPRSRYAYALEQLEREPLLYQQIQPVYFRGRTLSPR